MQAGAGGGAQDTDIIVNNGLNQADVNAPNPPFTFFRGLLNGNVDCHWDVKRPAAVQQDLSESAGSRGCSGGDPRVHLCIYSLSSLSDPTGVDRTVDPVFVQWDSPRAIAHV